MHETPFNSQNEENEKITGAFVETSILQKRRFAMLPREKIDFFWPR